MGLQGGGLATKQIAAPQAVFGMSEEGKPGGATSIRFWPVVMGQDPANHILVDFDTESQSDLVRNPRTAPARIPLLHFHNRIDQWLGWALGSGTASTPRRKQQAILALCQQMVKTQEGRRLEHDGGAEKTCLANEEYAYTGDDPVSGAKVRRSFAATVQDEQLVPDEHRLGNHAPEPSGLREPDQGDDRMQQEDQEIAHL
jgi:hypothetical protein